jgi:tetratricopeptide (TPR) repeat protein
MLGAAFAIAWEARQREHEAERALREEHTTKAVKDFLFGLFTAVDPHEAKGKDITARELLDRGAQRIGATIPGEPGLKAELQSVLGRIYYQLGLYTQASALQQQAIGVLAAAGDQPLLLARTQVDRADTMRDSGDLKAGAQLASEALERLRALPAASANDQVRALYALGSTAVLQRDFAEAKRQAGAMLAVAQSAHVDDDLYVYVLLQAANAAWGLHAMDASEKYNRQLLALAERVQGPEGLMVASAHLNLALVFSGRSQYPQAIAEVQKALDIDLKVRGPQHSKVADDRGLLGLYYFYQGHYGQSRQMLEQVVAAQRANLGSDHPDVAGTLMNLANTLCEIPDLGGAERDFSEARTIWQAKFGADFPGVQVATASLGYVHRLQGRLDEAAAELLAFKKFLDAHGQGNDPELRYQLGEVRRLQGKAQEAVDLDQQAVQFARAGSGEGSDVAALAHYYLGLALRDSGDRAGAEREFRAALASLAGYLPQGEHPLAATARLELAQLLAGTSQTREEARRLATQAVAIREQFLGADDARTLQARDALAKLTAH